MSVLPALLTWLSELIVSPALWLLAPMLVAQAVVERRDRNGSQK